MMQKGSTKSAARQHAPRDLNHVSTRLPPEAFRRWDTSADENFYDAPRFVTHIDDRAINCVTALYRELFPAGGAVLDLMSSWVSHLPEDVAYDRVVGLGMNRDELAANPRLDAYVVQNLNDDPRLPFEDAEFDACGCCVSIQYLTKPVAVLADLGRVMQAGAPVCVTFSNRCFPTKAVAIWQTLDDSGHIELVKRYLQDAGCWQEIEARQAPYKRGSDPLYAVIARRKA